MGVAGCGFVTGSGEKVGTVIKIAKEGIIFKTWEAEIIRGGMNNVSGGFSTKPFFFTITDKEMLHNVQQSFDSGKEIKIHYKRRFYIFNWNSECNGGECNFLIGIS